jgi:hypothetical protein
VLDGTIGQNAVQQAKLFAAAVPITGLVVTKLDGTARGGVVVAVHEALDVPVKFLGVGERATISSSSTRGVRAGVVGRGVKRDAPRQTRLRLDTPVTYLKGGAGARRGAQAARRRHGGRSALSHPASLRGREHHRAIASLETGMQGTVVGRVISKGVLPTRKGLRIFQAVLKDDTGMIEVSWPGQPFLDRTISKGDLLLVSGSVRFFHGRSSSRASSSTSATRATPSPRGWCSRSIPRRRDCRSR